MALPSESTRLEGPSGFVEYKGCNKLANKSALITGGDSGIGRAVATLMTREGADISIVYLPVKQEDAEETKACVEAENRSYLLIPSNLDETKGCSEVVTKYVGKYKKIDILVNNAVKQFKCENSAEINLDQVQGTFQTNIISMFALSKFALPHMRGGGFFVIDSSTP